MTLIVVLVALAALPILSLVGRAVEVEKALRHNMLLDFWWLKETLFFFLKTNYEAWKTNALIDGGGIEYYNYQQEKQETRVQMALNAMRDPTDVPEPHNILPFQPRSNHNADHPRLRSSNTVHPQQAGHRYRGSVSRHQHQRHPSQGRRLGSTPFNVSM